MPPSLDFVPTFEDFAELMQRGLKSRDQHGPRFKSLELVTKSAEQIAAGKKQNNTANESPKTKK